MHNLKGLKDVNTLKNEIIKYHSKLIKKENCDEEQLKDPKFFFKSMFDAPKKNKDIKKLKNFLLSKSKASETNIINSKNYTNKYINTTTNLNDKAVPNFYIKTNNNDNSINNYNTVMNSIEDINNSKNCLEFSEKTQKRIKKKKCFHLNSKNLNYQIFLNNSKNNVQYCAKSSLTLNKTQKNYSQSNSLVNSPFKNLQNFKKSETKSSLKYLMNIHDFIISDKMNKDSIEIISPEFSNSKTNIKYYNKDLKTDKKSPIDNLDKNNIAININQANELSNKGLEKNHNVSNNSRFDIIYKRNNLNLKNKNFTDYKSPQNTLKFKTIIDDLNNSKIKNYVNYTKNLSNDFKKNNFYNNSLKIYLERENNPNCQENKIQFNDGKNIVKHNCFENKYRYKNNKNINQEHINEFEKLDIKNFDCLKNISEKKDVKKPIFFQAQTTNNNIFNHSRIKNIKKNHLKNISNREYNCKSAATKRHGLCNYKFTTEPNKQPIIKDSFKNYFFSNTEIFPEDNNKNFKENFYYGGNKNKLNNFYDAERKETPYMLTNQDFYYNNL